MKTTSHDRSPAGKDAAVARAARDVRRAFARRRSPGDLDDVEQDAALAALEALARGNVDMGSPGPYLRKVAARAAGVGVSRALSVVSFPRKKAPRARDWQHRVPIDGCGYAEPRDDERSDVVTLGSRDDVESIRAAVARAVGEERMVTVVVRHVAALPAPRRVVAEVVLGLRPGSQPARTFREVAWRTGVSVARARGVVKQLARQVRDDVQNGAISGKEGT